jgi:hypothetical protein
MYDMPQHHYTIPYQSSALCSLLGSMISFPPEPESENYKDLVCTDKDKAIIYEILTTMDELGKFALLMKKNYMQTLGAQINHVHGLKFLSTIITNDRLRSCLKEVFQDYFKRNGFMDGIGPSLTQEAAKGLLDQYIDDFAAEVAVSSEQIKPYFQARDWEGLVRFFIAE